LCGEIHLSKDIDRRGGLYEALEGALVLGDEAVRERLRTFALERWEGLCQRGDALDRNVNDLECWLRGDEDFLDLPRQTVK
jgi:hypothetical protein